ncbi:MAG: hypothetical protein ACI8X5_003298 [Planctomycetota bacterium]|jgi:hypothetical protein
MKLHSTAIAFTLIAWAAPTSFAWQEEGELEIESFAEEETDEWAALDLELQSFEQLTLGTNESSAEIWGYVRGNVFYQDVTNSGAMHLDNLRVNLVGNLSDYNYRLTVDLASGKLQMEDAWVSTNLGEQFNFTLGKFKIPLLRSGMVEANETLFIARTRNGIFYSQRDTGGMFNGDHGRFHWRLSVQNGQNGVAERQLTTLHTSLNVMGEAEKSYEGAFGSDGSTSLTVGAGVSDDDTASHGTAVAFEANLVTGRFSAQAEWVKYGSGYTLIPDMEQRGDTSPWSLTTSYMLVPDKYEVALRYENFDDASAPLDFERRTFSAGINRYIEGHAIKWQFNIAAAHKGGNSDGQHDLLAALGVTLSF